MKSALGVAGPGADHGFLAAEFVTLAGRGVERARNVRLDRVAMGAAVAPIDLIVPGSRGLISDLSHLGSRRLPKIFRFNRLQRLPNIGLG